MEKNIVQGAKIEQLIDGNLGELLYALLNSFEDKILQVHAATDEKLTAAVLLRKAIRVAKFLQKYGIGVGDSVSVMSENRLEFCIIPVAAFLVGATFAPLNPEYTPGELQHVMNLSKPKVIFSSSQTVMKLAEIRTEYPFLKLLVQFGSDKIKYAIMGFDMLVKGAENDEPDFEVPPYDPNETVATILCSSGTTGMPKGVMCTHANMTSFISIASVVFERLVENMDQEGGTTVGITPFFHSFGFMNMFLSILQGKKVVVFDKFKPKLFLSAIVKHKVQRLMVPPSLLLFIAKNPIAKNYDLSGLKEVIAGAAPLPKETELLLKKRFKVGYVAQGYGMTETTLAVTTNPMDKAKTGSVGVLVPEMMAKIVDSDGNALGPHQEGELCLKGPLIMKGYVGDEKATRDCIDEDNWLHTGDVAYYDEDKYFFIVDRLKELIKYKGFQVAPAELESLLGSHPAILEAAVIGLPDEYAGELPLAFVVKKPGKQVSPKELQEYIAGKVSPQKQLRGGVRFIDEIPKNHSGKILRRVLKAMAIENMKSKL